MALLSPRLEKLGRTYLYTVGPITRRMLQNRPSGRVLSWYSIKYGSYSDPRIAKGRRLPWNSLGQNIGR